MLRNVTKFFLAGLGIALLAFGALMIIQYMQYRNNPEYRLLQDMENLKKQYAEDPYGGDTPEETLRLFVEALKKGDTDLAAKYFVLDKQAEWRKDLAKIKEKGLLDEMVRDVETRKEKQIEQDTARYLLIASDGQAAPLVLVNHGGRWKIRTL